MKAMATGHSPEMIGVVVPAHNEEIFIGPCLASIKRAASFLALSGCAVRTFVVCDACIDRTAEIVTEAGQTPLIANARNVGAARAMGASAAIGAGADWLAFTDADTVVSEDWLFAQIALGTDVVCGTVAVNDWEGYGDEMRRHFATTYQDSDGHRHIHGANLGISVPAYLRAGGFAMLTSSEDVAIVNALTRIGASIAWSAAPRVVTSARTDYRALRGFGAYLAATALQANIANELGADPRAFHK